MLTGILEAAIVHIISLSYQLFSFLYQSWPPVVGCLWSFCFMAQLCPWISLFLGYIFKWILTILFGPLITKLSSREIFSSHLTLQPHNIGLLYTYCDNKTDNRKRRNGAFMAALLWKQQSLVQALRECIMFPKGKGLQCLNEWINRSREKSYWNSYRTKISIWRTEFHREKVDNISGSNQWQEIFKNNNLILYKLPDLTKNEWGVVAFKQMLYFFLVSFIPVHPLP